MLTLYYAPGSSSFAPHIALNEVGAPYEGRVVSFATKEPASAAYKAINPEGKVPTLLVDGLPLTEVAGILYYIARTYPQAKLMPANDPLGEAQVISWMSFIASTLHPARQKGPEHATAMYQLADERLGRRTWTVGDSYTIADIHLFRLYWRFAGSLQLPAGSLPNLKAHHDRVVARLAVQKTIAIEKAAGYELP